MLHYLKLIIVIILKYDSAIYNTNFSQFFSRSHFSTQKYNFFRYFRIYEIIARLIGKLDVLRVKNDNVLKYNFALGKKVSFQPQSE